MIFGLSIVYPSLVKLSSKSPCFSTKLIVCSTSKVLVAKRLKTNNKTTTKTTTINKAIKIIFFLFFIFSLPNSLYHK